MAHQHERRLETCVLHEAMQLPSGRIAPRGVRSGITPTEIGTVVPARARKGGYAALGRRPHITRRRAATHEDHGRTAFSGAVDVQGSATDVDRAPDLLQYPTVAP